MLTALWSANYVCHLCRAHKRIRRLWWTQSGRGSRLRNTLCTNHQFLGWHLGQRVYSAFLLLIGFDIWRVWSDALHTLDLGIYQYAVPSALWELTRDQRLWPGSTRASRLLLAYRDYKVWCSQHGVSEPVKKFEKKSFKKEKSKLIVWTQKTAKGAQMKHIVFWLAELCNRQNTNAHESVRASLFNSFVMFECACASQGRFCCPEAAEQIAVATEAALDCYNYLACQAGLSGIWHMVPKFHMYSHMGYDFAKKANPRRVQCYSDEDLIGKVKRILERCHGATADKKGLLRYMFWVCLRWWILLHRLRNVPVDVPRAP